MKIFVSVKTGAREDSIEKIDENHFQISVMERPVKGQANRGVIRVVANHFKVTKPQVSITSGHTSPLKTLKINQ